MNSGLVFLLQNDSSDVIVSLSNRFYSENSKNSMAAMHNYCFRRREILHLYANAAIEIEWKWKNGCCRSSVRPLFPATGLVRLAGWLAAYPFVHFIYKCNKSNPLFYINFIQLCIYRIWIWNENITNNSNTLVYANYPA